MGAVAGLIYEDPSSSLIGDVYASLVSLLSISNLVIFILN